MAREVFANSREIFSKKSGTKVVLPTIDVCHTPPPPPPMAAAKIGIPIPYPNFSKSKNMQKGTKTVKIRGKMVGKKNLSFIKTSNGNEVATSQFRKGLIDGVIKGKTYATSWSFDVMVEKKNVARHKDTAKHNVK